MQQQTQLRNIKDGNMFRLSPRKTAATYVINSKKKGVGTYTSVMSSRTFTAPLTTIVFKSW